MQAHCGKDVATDLGNVYCCDKYHQDPRPKTHARGQVSGIFSFDACEDWGHRRNIGTRVVDHVPVFLPVCPLLDGLVAPAGDGGVLPGARHRQSLGVSSGLECNLTLALLVVLAQPAWLLRN